MSVVISTFFRCEGRLAVRCYHERDPKEIHRAHHVVEMMVSKPAEVNLRWLCWGRRDQHFPICPEHRVSTDADW